MGKYSFYILNFILSSNILKYPALILLILAILPIIFDESKLSINMLAVGYIILIFVIFMIFKILKIHSVLSNTMVLLTAMPTAAITSILAENLNKEKEYATILVFISTVLSLVTFPLIAYVVI